MGTDRRLFLAAALDDDMRHALATFVSAPGMPPIPGRRVPPPNWHITLRFLGRSTTVQQDLVLAVLGEELDQAPFHIGFGGLGAFPYPAKATVLWLAVVTGGERLEELAVSCERAAVRAGYDPEERPYHPHLSLSRVRPHQNLTELVEQYPTFPGRLRIDSVVLYESITSSNGARYTE
ncbi:MAG: RNA 2',3'-cyclic phosphodiesterase, partial [Acidimicrobiia bacterium]|nr:RNA 2',3'-cyclic phosphodiesterase [Acidimicrobiia bacterium]